MTAPATGSDAQLSGQAADAVADMRAELARRSTELNTAEADLAEALLTAQATTDAGRHRLHDIQRQVIEAIANPVNALDTPAGERQFLIFLRSKVAEIQSVLDDGTLTAHDQAEIMSALTNEYLADAPPATPSESMPTSSLAAPMGASPAAGMSAMPQSLGGLPQSLGGLPQTGAAMSPLAGLSSLLPTAQRADDAIDDGRIAPGHDPRENERDEHDEHERGRGKHDERTDDEEDDQEPVDGEPPPFGTDDSPPTGGTPAETRPAAS